VILISHTIAAIERHGRCIEDGVVYNIIGNYLLKRDRSGEKYFF